MGVVWTFFLSSITSVLWETARYRLKYCLKGPLSPKQPTNYWLQSNLYRKVKKFGHIVLYVFLGTSDLTARKGKFIELRQDDVNKAFYYLKFQIDI